MAETLHDIVHDIVKLLPHRQEVLDDLHERIRKSEGAPAAAADQVDDEKAGAPKKG